MAYGRNVLLHVSWGGDYNIFDRLKEVSQKGIAEVLCMFLLNVSSRGVKNIFMITSNRVVTKILPR